MKYLDEYRDADVAQEIVAFGTLYVYERHLQPIDALHQIASIAVLGAMIHGG